jgi:hypothetical protein
MQVRVMWKPPCHANTCEADLGSSAKRRSAHWIGSNNPAAHHGYGYAGEAEFASLHEAKKELWQSRKLPQGNG